MKPREFKRIWGKPWDWGYLISLERAKLREMADYFEKEDRFVGVEKVVRDIRICLKLIDIICEKDEPYRAWLHTSYGNCDLYADHKKIIRFPRHINIRNRARFLYNDFLEDNSRDENYQSTMEWDLKIEYRKIKALYLYHKIRTMFIFNWWS